MAKLSKFHTIAPLNVLVRPEIDRALQMVFGQPAVVREAQVFGMGAAHALNHPLQPFRIPPDRAVDSEYKRMFEAWAAREAEWLLLAGLPPESGVDERQLDAMQDEAGVQLAEEQERLRMSRRENGWHTGDRAKRLSKAVAFTSWEDELTEALEHAGLNWGHIYGLDRDGASRLIESIPIIHVSAELQRQREAAAEKPWTPNDLNDVFFLMVALVYCDIVVTEKQWVDLARRSGLDEKYGTLLVSDLAELPGNLL